MHHSNSVEKKRKERTIERASNQVKKVNLGAQTSRKEKNQMKNQLKKMKQKKKSNETKSCSKKECNKIKRSNN